MSGQISLEASINKSEVTLDSSFSVTFSLETNNSKASNNNINYPDLSDFDRIGTSTGYQMDMRTVIKSITYTLRPRKEGTFQIGKASVTINGKNYETQPLTITVTEEKRSIPKEQINAILRALEEEEKDIQKRMIKRESKRQVKNKKTEKDW